MEKASIRALDWLRMRWDYGFIKYYSSVYYKEDIGGLTNYLWGSVEEIGPHMMYGMMHSTNHKLPTILKEIALDSSRVIIKQNNGLDLSELKAEGYFGSDNRSMMIQWGMESFTNPEVVRNSLAHIRNQNTGSVRSITGRRQPFLRETVPGKFIPMKALITKALDINASAFM